MVIILSSRCFWYTCGTCSNRVNWLLSFQYKICSCSCSCLFFMYIISIDVYRFHHYHHGILPALLLIPLSNPFGISLNDNDPQNHYTSSWTLLHISILQHSFIHSSLNNHSSIQKYLLSSPLFSIFYFHTIASLSSNKHNLNYIPYYPSYSQIYTCVHTAHTLVATYYSLPAPACAVRIAYKT